MMTAPLIAIEFSGLEALEKVKKMLGNINPILAEKHTFRHWYGKNTPLYNAFYCSQNNFEAL